MKMGWWGAMAAGVGAAALAFAPAPAAAQTRAGTTIANVADARVDGTALRSDTVALLVDERLDVTLAAVPVEEAGVQPVLVGNIGNGRESIVVAATAGDVAVALFVDSDGDGRFDPARDQALTETGVAVDPGASARLFAVVPAGAGAGATLTVTARAATGNGTPGTSFAGRGDGGGDAVVGTTGAAATLAIDFAPGAAPVATLVKSAEVVASDGSVRAVAGARIAYTLVAGFATATDAAEVADAVPAGTRFVAGSILLDGTALSDADDEDAASFDGAAIRWRLGAQPAGAERRLSFQVTVE